MSKDEKFWSIEEHFHGKDTKASRKDRNLASKRDRSKYKKSDQDQLKKSNQQEFDHLNLGRVLAIVPEGILVSSNGKEHLCTLKGSLKQERNKMKNLIAVGDFVRFEEKSATQGWIVKVQERHSILSRADNLSRNKEQLIAVNIDQVFITTSVVFPALKPFLVDRYIIATQKGNMEPIILINKIDLLNSPPEEIPSIEIEKEKQLLEEFLITYRVLGFKVIPISIKTGEGLSELTTAMDGKTSVFSGQSGVGKSSLINLVTGSSLMTGAVVQRTGKGSHTTTTTQLVPLPAGGFCIDTPGIKSFGIWDLKKEDVAAYFSEIFEFSSDCKYPDCAHINEPECAVKEAVAENKISPLRFASYLALIASVSQEHKQR